MILTLISFITSLFLQVGAVGIPFELVPDDNTLLLIQQIRSACLESDDAGCLFFADTVQNYGYSTMPYYIELGSNGANNYRVCFPTSYQNSSLTSSCESTWYTLSNGAILCNIRWVNYTVFWYNSDTDTLTSSQNRDSSTAEVVVPYRDGEGRTSLVCLNGDIRDSNGNIIIYYEDFIEDTSPGDDPSPLINIGSLNLNGHSAGGNPSEELSNFGWSSHSSSFNVTGHSTGVNPSIANFDFSNGVQNLLGQLVDNTNDLIFNSNSLGQAINNLNSNVINGFSAIFNGLSAGFSSLSDELHSEYFIDFESVSNAWHDTTLYTLVSFADSTPSTISNTSDDIIISWDFSNLRFGVPDNNIDVSAIRSISGSYNISQALNPSKCVWQPLLLTFLYGFTFWNFIRSLPNIINGVSSVSNSKEVKEKLK